MFCPFPFLSFSHDNLKHRRFAVFFILCSVVTFSVLPKTYVWFPASRPLWGVGEPICPTTHGMSVSLSFPRVSCSSFDGINSLPSFFIFALFKTRWMGAFAWWGVVRRHDVWYASHTTWYRVVYLDMFMLTFLICYIPFRSFVLQKHLVCLGKGGHGINMHTAIHHHVLFSSYRHTYTQRATNLLTNLSRTDTPT